jgi:hypothetical protein
MVFSMKILRDAVEYDSKFVAAIRFAGLPIPIAGYLYSPGQKPARI